jgi:hypothetical protein
VSQPFDRGAKCPAPGQCDSSLKEWWTSNPWQIIREGHNLSCYERKRAFLNVRGPDGDRNFLEVSYLTGADNDGDGRAVVAGDFRHNGQLDLLLRQTGGGSVLLYENHFPRRHFLEVSLRGSPEDNGSRRSNAFGIGARLIATVDGRQLVRELYPHNSFMSQMPTVVHFGLGDARRVQKLKILWPSGRVQELTDLAGDRHIRIEEGSDRVQTVWAAGK